METTGCLLIAVARHIYLFTFTANVLPVRTLKPASEVDAVVRSPTNMAAAKIAAVDFNKMTSKWRHSTGLLAAMFVGDGFKRFCCYDWT